MSDNEWSGAEEEDTREPAPKAALEKRMKVYATAAVQGFPVLRKGELVPAWNDDRDGSIILHPPRVFEDEVASQRRKGKPDANRLLDSISVIYRCSPQAGLNSNV